MEKPQIELLKGILNAQHARIARLETTVLTLLKTLAMGEGLPPGFNEMLKADSWLHTDGVEPEPFRSTYARDMASWRELLQSLPEQSPPG